RPTTTATPYDRQAGLRALAEGAARARTERWQGKHGEENRRLQSERTRARWARMTPEERERVSRAISAGRRHRCSSPAPSTAWQCTISAQPSATPGTTSQNRSCSPARQTLTPARSESGRAADGWPIEDRVDRPDLESTDRL